MNSDVPFGIPGLLDNDWRENAYARLPEIFPNQGARAIAMLCAATHRYAIDYLEQAPAVIAYVGWGVVPKTHNDRALIAQRFGSAAKRGLRLRDFLAEFKAPLPIRKLRSVAVCPANFSAIVDLRRLELSDLAQAIPEKASAQATWLRTMREWRRYERARPGMLDLYRWAAMSFGREASEGIGSTHIARDIWDFIVNNPPGALNPRWSLAAALAAIDRWHGDLGKRRDEEAFLLANGIGFEDPIDYGHLPESREVMDLAFVALRSGLDLFTEGAAMHHCVSSYSRRVVLGDSFIYSIRRGDRRIATLELVPRPNDRRAFDIAQLAGPCNVEPNKAVRLAAMTFVQQENARLAAEWKTERKQPKDMAFWTGAGRLDGTGAP